MSKNKVKIGITVIIILVLAVLGICGYVGYNYVQDEINGERYSSDPYTLVIEKDDFAYQIGEKALLKMIPFGIGGWISTILILLILTANMKCSHI